MYSQLNKSQNNSNTRGKSQISQSQSKGQNFDLMKDCTNIMKTQKVNKNFLKNSECKENENFFQKIITDPLLNSKSYQSQFKNKKQFQKYGTSNSIAFMNKQAITIQRAWHEYRRRNILKRVLQQEKILDQLSGVKRSHQCLSNLRTNEFDKLIIERLILDLTISNKIISGLQAEVKKRKNENLEQFKKTKSVFEEYFSFINNLLNQKEDLERQISTFITDNNKQFGQFPLQNQSLLQKPHNSLIQSNQNLINEIQNQFSQIGDLISQSQVHIMGDLRENIQMICDTMNLKFENSYQSDQEIVELLKQILKHQQDMISKKEEEITTLKNHISSLKEQVQIMKDNFEFQTQENLRKSIGINNIQSTKGDELDHYNSDYRDIEIKEFQQSIFQISQELSQSINIIRMEIGNDDDHFQ